MDSSLEQSHEPEHCSDPSCWCQFHVDQQEYEENEADGEMKDEAENGETYKETNVDYMTQNALESAESPSQEPPATQQAACLAFRSYGSQIGSTGRDMQLDNSNRQYARSPVAGHPGMMRVFQYTYSGGRSTPPGAAWTAIPPQAPATSSIPGFACGSSGQAIYAGNNTASYEGRGQAFHYNQRQPRQPSHHEASLQEWADRLNKRETDLRRDTAELDVREIQLHEWDSRLAQKEHTLRTREGKFKKAFDGHRKAIKNLYTTSEALHADIERREQTEQRESERQNGEVLSMRQ